MSHKKEYNKTKNHFFGLIGGNINQIQNCNINVEQPNNNVVCSKDTNTNQNNYTNFEQGLLKKKIRTSGLIEGKEELNYDCKQNNKANQYGMQANANVHNSKTKVEINQGNGSKQENK